MQLKEKLQYIFKFMQQIPSPLESGVISWLYLGSSQQIKPSEILDKMPHIPLSTRWLIAKWKKKKV